MATVSQITSGVSLDKIAAPAMTDTLFSIAIDDGSGEEFISQIISVIRRYLERQGIEAIMGIDHNHAGQAEIFGWVRVAENNDPPTRLLLLVNDISSALIGASVKLIFKQREKRKLHPRGLLALRNGRDCPDSWLPSCCEPWASLTGQSQVLDMVTLPLIQSHQEGAIWRSKQALGLTARIVAADIATAAARFGHLAQQLFDSGQVEEAGYWLMNEDSVQRYGPKT